jgi:hypothetical protein
MRKKALRIDGIAVQTFEMGVNPLSVLNAGSDEEQTRVGGCTVLTTCSPGCSTTVEETA